MTNEIQRFSALLQSSDTLIEQATKEDVAEVARVLALHVAHYRARYGDVPNKDSLKDAAHRKNQRRAGQDARRPIRGIG
ncbi:MAG TPA: hypothetical protein EYN14_13015 [Alphaproteobacteria bacterium]|nr:hypothetical protein [Alphaproteobacteria bacterium]